MWWEFAIAACAIVAGAVAIWVTLSADFLAHPGWLALQKADLIVGPVFVGLYWLRRRPRSRFGPLLIACGFANVLYIPQSSPEPVLFSVGLLAEPIVLLANLTLILTFPTGRLDRWPERIVLIGALVIGALPYLLTILVSPVLVPAGSISGCSGPCPDNGLLVHANPQLAADLVNQYLASITVFALATLAVVGWRLATATAPRRRALATGAPIAVFFLGTAALHRFLMLIDVNAPELMDVLAWALVIARSSIWYGFLLALIAAQLFAGRVLLRIVGASLRRPSVRELEAMLRDPLGDPALRLAFRRRDGSWVDSDNATIPTPPAESGRVVTEVERKGRAPLAIFHDEQLSEEPELLRAAGAVALLAAENTDLESAWNAALTDLQDSRARTVVAGDRERRRLERNLHDGVQQRLVAVLINMTIAGEKIDAAGVDVSLAPIAESIEAAIGELRAVAHGLYPPILSSHGLVVALSHVARQSPARATVTATDVGRHAAELESAIYYCCLEALTNAAKHGGPDVRITIHLQQSAEEIQFVVADDGAGFDALIDHQQGSGLQNMHDRVGALGGLLDISSSPRRGTTVSGTCPITDHPNGRSEFGPPSEDDEPVGISADA